MTKTTDKARLAAAFQIIKDIHNNSAAYAEKYPSGTSFTPLSTEGGVLNVRVQRPNGPESIERAPLSA